MVPIIWQATSWSAHLRLALLNRPSATTFPNKRIAIDSYTHDLNQLIRVAGLQTILESETRRDKDFAINWAIVKDWSEESRYERHDAATAKGLYSAVADTRHGVLRWLERHW